MQERSVVVQSRMVAILCPHFGRRLLNTRITLKKPRIYPIVGKTPEHTDTEIKCHRFKTVVGIEK